MVAELRENWRDVGATLRPLLGAQDADDSAVAVLPSAGMLLAPIGQLLRCGRIDFATHAELGSPRTILNLRIDTDEFAEGFLSAHGVQALHVPAANDTEKYHTRQHSVRLWLAAALKPYESAANYPILVHCKHGRDRTGLVVAAVLLILGTPPSIVAAEYALSSGAKNDLFREALEGFGVVAARQSLVAAGRGRGRGAAARASAGSVVAAPEDAMRTYLRGLVDVDAIRSAVASVAVRGGQG